MRPTSGLAGTRRTGAWSTRSSVPSRIEQVDAIIDDLLDQLAVARRDREAIVAEAWTRGNVVRLADLQDEIASHPWGIL